MTIGDDIEPVEGISYRCQRRRESSEQELPTNETNPKNQQEREDCGHAVHKNWRGACVKDRGATVQLEALEEEEGRERTTPRKAFDCGVLTQEKTLTRFQF